VSTDKQQQYATCVAQAGTDAGKIQQCNSILAP
jgi:hypothetical protein